MCRNNYYFNNGTFNQNLLEIDEDGDAVTIFNEDDTHIMGVGDIGQAAEALDLCCTAYWNDRKRRVEIRVH